MKREACASCAAISFLHTGAFQYINLSAPPFSGATHLDVSLWGAQGGGLYNVGAYGAFVSGILPLAGLGPLLRVVSGTCAYTPSVLTGMGGGTQGYPWQTAGGGRSSIQAPSALVSDGWIDIVTAGGGAGDAHGIRVPASARGGTVSPGGIRDCSLPYGCTSGAWLAGAISGAAWGAAGGGGAGGGGGWCGGLGAEFYYPTGGGTSYTDNLLCSWGADGDELFTRTPRFDPVINSCGAWACAASTCSPSTAPS